MSLFKRLFGGGGSPEREAASEEYEGFRITAAPMREGTQWRVGARIEKGDRVHEFVRADTVGDEETAVAFSVRKAKQVIDEQGDRVFD